MWAAALVCSSSVSACPGAPLAGRCIYGNITQRLPAASAAACCALCAAALSADKPCAGWQFGASCKYCSAATPCVLKGDVPASYADNCTSGIVASPAAPTPAPAPPPPSLPTPPPSPPPAIELASLFVGGAAVLQQHAHAAVWGTSRAGAGATVTVSLDGAAVAEASVDASGGWRAYLPPQPAGWAPVVLRATTSDGGAAGAAAAAGNSSSGSSGGGGGSGSSGSGSGSGSGSSAEASVRFGHVVLCSGQSNMQMPVNHFKEGGFAAANGTAEAAAAGRYAGKISLLSLQTPFPHPTAPPWNGTGCGRPNDPSYHPSPACFQPQWNRVSPGPNGTLHGFSAVCWYTGKALFERLGGAAPVGLAVGSVGGSAIELWLPPGDVNATGAACGVDDPPCDTTGNLTDSLFYNAHIAPLAPYTLGAVVWDQGERDVHCFGAANNHTARYPCLQRELVRSWRKAFNSSFAFAAVQLPGYIGDCDGNGAAPYTSCVPGVFGMRLSQDAGVPTGAGAKAAVTVTYDLGCPFGVKTAACPFGSVHNLIKDAIGSRVAAQIAPMLPGAPPPSAASSPVVEGPRAVAVTATASAAPGAAGAGGGDGGGGAPGSSWAVTVRFAGGSGPLYTGGTQYCDACCAGAVGDFDASADGGATFVNGTVPVVVVAVGGGAGAPMMSVRFSVPGLGGKPTHVRFTANQGAPQCAVYNAEGLPAYPFAMAVTP